MLENNDTSRQCSARAVLILNENHEIIYSELVQEVTDEPNYENAIAAVKV